MIADKNEIIFIAHADCLEDAEFVKEKMIPYYPLGVFKDLTGEGK